MGHTALVINLPGDKTRLSLISARLSRAGVNNLSIIEAIDGNDINKKDLELLYDEKAALNRTGRHFTRGELGCALSHQKAYRHIINNGLQWSFIFEDDAMPATDLIPFIPGIDQWMSTNKPRVLLLTPLRVFNSKSRIALEADCNIVKVIKAWNGAAYVINRSAANILATINNRVHLMADDWTSYGHLSTIQLYGVDPWLAGQDSGLNSSLEDGRADARTRKQKSAKYRLAKLKGNLRLKTIEWLWLRPLGRFGEHR